MLTIIVVFYVHGCEVKSVRDLDPRLREVNLLGCYVVHREVEFEAVADFIRRFASCGSRVIENGLDPCDTLGPLYLVFQT